MKTNIGIRIAVIALALVALPLLAADLTVTGKVISIGPDTLVISTPSGQQTYVLNTSTIKPAGLVADNTVVITYHDENGRMLASNIAMAPAIVATTPAPATPPAGTGALNNNRNDRVVGDGEDDNVTGYDRDAARDGTDAGQSPNAAAPAPATTSKLPATASNMPLLALAGAVALAGALAFRNR